MLLVTNNAGERARATPGASGVCPGCRGEVIAKCGAVKLWHWAHKKAECDSWSEPESKWHLRWKEIFGFENCEIVMGNHRADIVGRDGVVIELQHSSINGATVIEREQFYKNMIWIVDATPFAHNLSIFPWSQKEVRQVSCVGFERGIGGGLKNQTFCLRDEAGPNFILEWSWARKVWTEVAKAPVYLHCWHGPHKKQYAKRLLRLPSLRSSRMGGEFVTIDSLLEIYRPQSQKAVAVCS